ncbi:hypothetical protein P170DRAFT_223224 [Aspergillus steynii IBT 23096]|uniref:Uncharacterized protein n=1 Tax=Aspergillus steynii IBT 23096 TaxID=1392250 RepID=A0A2I2G1P4_9EURO|nr:uncharacterized protein P170DRAFT_223224 [Aspergillus steynii IBT 23096]PLB46797.1 hypothetical protein P170DRAFT_223224 [Aspergillus steynii IBT 23096]
MYVISIFGDCVCLLDRPIPYRPGWVTRIPGYARGLFFFIEWRDEMARIGCWHRWFIQGLVSCLLFFRCLVLASLVLCIGRLSMMYPISNHPNLKYERILMGQIGVRRIPYCAP